MTAIGFIVVFIATIGLLLADGEGDFWGYFWTFFLFSGTTLMAFGLFEWLWAVAP